MAIDMAKHVNLEARPAQDADLNEEESPEAMLCWYFQVVAAKKGANLNTIQGSDTHPRPRLLWHTAAATQNADYSLPAASEQS